MYRSAVPTARDGSGAWRPDRYRLINPASKQKAAASIKNEGAPPRVVSKKSKSKPPTATATDPNINPIGDGLVVVGVVRLEEVLTMRRANTPSKSGPRKITMMIGEMSSAKMGVKFISGCR